MFQLRHPAGCSVKRFFQYCAVSSLPPALFRHSLNYLLETTFQVMQFLYHVPTYTLISSLGRSKSISSIRTLPVTLRGRWYQRCSCSLTIKTLLFCKRLQVSGMLKYIGKPSRMAGNNSPSWMSLSRCPIALLKKKNNIIS